MSQSAGASVERVLVVGVGTLAVLAGIMGLLAMLPRPAGVSPPVPAVVSVEVGLVDLTPPVSAPTAASEPSAEPPPVQETAPPEPAPLPEPAPPPPEPEPAAQPVPPPPVPPQLHPKPPPRPVRPVAKPVEPPMPQPAPAAASGPAPPIPSPAATPSAPSQAPGGGTTAARAIVQPMPDIPPELRRQALRLVAVVRFAIAADGSARAELTEATPNPELNRVLLQAFARWRFFPATEQGRPVASELTLRVPITVE